MTIGDQKLIQVRNLAANVVVFNDEDTHRRIVFQPGEKKKIDAGTLRRLNYSRGGSVLLQEYLAVEDKELADEFGVDEEVFTHEYAWTNSDVKRVLTEGSLDELKDALDFAPEGIVEMIINNAVDMELNDVVKRQTIKDMTGADIDAKIKNKKAVQNNNAAPAANKTRRVKETGADNDSKERRVTQ